MHDQSSKVLPFGPVRTPRGATLTRRAMRFTPMDAHSLRQSEKPDLYECLRSGADAAGVRLAPRSRRIAYFIETLLWVTIAVCYALIAAGVL